jgi:hypothetical protein
MLYWEVAQQAGRSLRSRSERKVRALPGSALGNTQAPEAQASGDGKWHRNIPPDSLGKGEMVGQEPTGCGVNRRPSKPRAEQGQIGGCQGRPAQALGLTA